MTDEEIKKNINEIVGSLTKKNLSYALTIFKALQQGEEAVKEEIKSTPASSRSSMLGD